MALKLLIVDDEASVCKLLKTVLEPLGLEILTLTDSQEAARRVEREKFDGILLDARMPVLDGFELSKHIRHAPLNCGVPIVMITALGDAESMRRAFRAGITFFLNKPLDQDKLYNLFRVARSSFLREKRRHVRIPYRTTVVCHIGQERFTTGSINISESGIAVESAAGVPVGEVLDLTIRLPHLDEPLQVRAKVIRKELPDLTAFQFVELAPSAQEAIREYIYGKVKE